MLTSYNGQTITYDAIGNPLSYRDGITMTWQNGRELATYADGTNSVSYSYEASGMRTAKAVTKGTTTDNYKYIYENGLLMQMRCNNIILDFTYGANGRPIGFAYRASAASTPSYYYYALNSRGDVVGLYNSSGALIVNYKYDAYGKLLGITNSSGSAITAKYSYGVLNPLRYRGYVYDTETGFYYLQSRYYDPTTCRFVNGDIYCNTGVEIVGCNMFAYCNNDSINYCDSNGTRPIVAASTKEETDIDRSFSFDYMKNTNSTVDLTNVLTEFMNDNLDTFDNYIKEHGNIPSAIYFYFEVKDYGELDIKRQSEWEFEDGKNYFFNGMKLRYDDPGNINFGYVGARLFPLKVLCIGAGGNQFLNYGFSFGDKSTYFDDYRDNYMVKYGYSLY